MLHLGWYLLPSPLGSSCTSLVGGGLGVSDYCAMCFPGSACPDQIQALTWLCNIRTELGEALAEVDATSPPEQRRPELTFRIGVSGPTPCAQLETWLHLPTDFSALVC